MTDQEAANVAWRRRAAQLSKQYRQWSPARIKQAGLPSTLEEALSSIPTKVPAWSDTKVAVPLTLPARLVVLAHAHAELEGGSLAQLIELSLYELVTNSPRRPKDVQAAYEKMLDETLRAERGQL